MDLILAFSLQDQVEKYGAYVGLAAFIGLAVLSLLYFAQARELKRLRDWAGRAPERAQELQARVVAQAAEALSAPEVEPAVERSGAVGPAQPVAQPAAGNGRQAGTPAPIPMGPRPAIAMAAAAARAAAAPATVEHEQAGGEEPETAGDGEAPAADDRAAAAPSGGDGAAPPAAEVASGDEDRAAAEPEPAEAGNGVPAQPPADLPPTTIPRATPRPQPKPQARPAPAAALQASTTRSTTLPRPRRTSRRPQRDDGSRTGLYTLVGLLVLAIAIFVPVYFMVLSGDDDTTPPPNPIAEPGGTPSSDTGAGEQAAAARPEKVVVVLNGTSIDGLASRQRDKLIAAGYVDGMIRIDNSDDQSRQDSLVLYGEDERRQARDVARLLDISRMEEIDEETQALADSSDESGTLPADVVVMLGTDKSP
jgi:hypothetical protein